MRTCSNIGGQRTVNAKRTPFPQSYMNDHLGGGQGDESMPFLNYKDGAGTHKKIARSYIREILAVKPPRRTGFCDNHSSKLCFLNLSSMRPWGV